MAEFSEVEKERLNTLLRQFKNETEKKNKKTSKISISFNSSNSNEYAHCKSIRKHIVDVYKFILNLSDEQIKGVFAHELGHLVNKHLLKIMISIIFCFLCVFNVIFLAYVVFVKLSILNFFSILILIVIVSLIMFAVIQGILFYIRILEYCADKFAYELGYGNQLIQALQKLEEDKDTFTSKFFRTHPPTNNRINKLKKKINIKNF